ncbi:MAG TPA: hypothetical protein VFO01_11170 [Trebonia sp.]|nr:hypothetical protein [Trebonia sp.]
MTAVTDTPAILDARPAPAPPDDDLAKATQWANDYLGKLTARTSERLAQVARTNGSASSSGQIRPEIGEPAVGPYVAFDVATTSPIQFTGLPPYQPSKVIAAGEAAYLVAFLWINPVPDPSHGFAVPPTVQLGGRGWRLTLDLADLTTLTTTKLAQAGTYGSPAPSLSFAVFSVPTPDPGADAAVYEANMTFDITNPGQPYAAFATNFFDVDDDPGFLFVPPAVSQWRHELPNRYLVYHK